MSPDYQSAIWTSWSVATNTLTINSAVNQMQLQQIWTQWVGQAATQQNIAAINQQVATIAQSQIWTSWVQASNVSYTTVAPARRQAATTEQQERWRQDQERATRIEQDRRRAEDEAKAKAEVLLLRHLSDQQKADLKTKGFFLVEVAGETYKIMRGFAGNVKMLDKATGKDAKSFCIHPSERVPDADAMLAQKLLLETDTERFHKIANVTELMPRAPGNDNRRAA